LHDRVGIFNPGVMRFSSLCQSVFIGVRAVEKK